MTRNDDHRCLRCAVDIFNAITFIGGGIIIAFGIYLIVEVNRLGAYQSTALAAVILIFGILIFLAAFLGFFGAHKNNTCLLTAFCVIISFLIVAQIIVASLVLVSQSVVSYQLLHIFLSYIDDLQKEYECCGGTGPSDWNGKIPESCCANGMPNCSSPYRTGCAKALFSFIKPVFLGVALSIFANSLIQLCSVICAACLASKIRNYEKV
nr:tetraspanin [Hymenolepis microstoma]